MFEKVVLYGHSALRRTLAFICASALLASSLPALADQAEAPPEPPPEPPPAPPPEPEPVPPPYTQPEQPPPPYGYPPGYGQQPPPPGYAPGYGYGYPAGATAPRIIDDWEEGDPIPPGYKPDTRVRKGLVIAGAVTLGAVWLLNVLAASIAISIEEADEDISGGGSVSPEDWYPLFIPAAGPFITIATVGAGPSGTAFLIFDGVVQTGGLAMFIIGLAAQQTVLVRKSYASEPKVRVTPLVGRDFSGMGMSGTF